MNPGAAEPYVGIFWLFPDGSLLVDTGPLGAAEKYGDCLTHSGSHIDVWAELQSSGRAPADVEYDEYPRGRVIFDTRQDSWVIRADRCILRERDLIRKIRASMNLAAANTETAPDLHYRCLRCLYGPPKENDDDEP